MLIRRAVSHDVARKLLARRAWWEEYTRINNAELNNNPSPGNKAGGLTTILEKSLGAAAKGGSTTLNAVYEYGEPIDERGFVFMDRSEEHTSELQSLMRISYAVFCLKKKKE